MCDTIANVLTGEPDWKALSTRAPSKVVTLLRRCLEKDATKRPRDMAEVVACLIGTTPRLAVNRNDEMISAGGAKNSQTLWLVRASGPARRKRVANRP